MYSSETNSCSNQKLAIQFQNRNNVDIPDVPNILERNTSHFEVNQTYCSKLDKNKFDQEIHSSFLYGIKEAVNPKGFDFPIFVSLYDRIYSAYVFFISVGKGSEKNVSVRKNKFYDTLDKHIDPTLQKTTVWKGDIYSFFEKYVSFSMTEVTVEMNEFPEKKEIYALLDHSLFQKFLKFLKRKKD